MNMFRYSFLDHNTDALPSNGSIHCPNVRCREQIAWFKNYVRMSQSDVLGLFNWVFNVRIKNNVNYYTQTKCVTSTAKTYCIKCEKILGWMITGIHRENEFIKQGRFCMRLDKLTYSNNLPLVRLIKNQFLQANEENADQGGGSDEDYDDNIPDYMMNLVELIAYLGNDQNADQHGGSDEKNAD
ncbi:uncharacterized protein [Solanum lycopersicum]|uniref:uncharacterized protein n=1 Tax=Solanum lycopersicum TaxID=4081 RepID=UPI00374818F1